MNLTRREALRYLSAGTLLTLGMWPGALRGGDNDSSFRFVVLNDLHFMSPECGQWFEGLVAHIKQQGGVEFCLIAGDLTEKGQRRELAALREVFQGLGVPVYVTIGNHDYASATDRRPYEKVFPRRINYTFNHRGWQFVGLDTTHGTAWEETQIQGDTFMWVYEHLRKWDKKAPLVLFTHFPLGTGVKYRPGNADLLLSFFQEHNLQAVFSGHWHGFTERRIRETLLTTNACCALKRDNHDRTRRKGYFLCTASEGRLSREFVEYKGKTASA